MDVTSWAGPDFVGVAVVASLVGMGMGTAMFVCVGVVAVVVVHGWKERMRENWRRVCGGSGWD